MLIMAAFELGDPMALTVLVKADNPLFHDTLAKRSR